jgi:predicted dehydrogenase
MRIGVIGSGFGLYGLLPAFLATPGCEVVAICGKKSERLVKYCDSVGLFVHYIKWEEMLGKERLDAVAIAVKPSAQYQIVKKAFEKGLHVFAEKPLTADLDEARELEKLAEKKRVTTIVDFIFPEIDEWQEAKRLVDSCAYGKLTHINVAWDFLSYDVRNQVDGWKTRSEEGGGALAFYGSHTLYYIENFAGAIEEVKSNFTYSKESIGGAEVAVDATFTCTGGAAGTLHISCVSKEMNRHRVELVCEKAILVLEANEGVTEHFSLTVRDEDGERAIEIVKEKGRRDEDERVRTVAKLTKRFVAGAKEGRQVTPALCAGVRVQELIEKIRNQNLPNHE